MVYSISFCSDNKCLAVGTEDGEIYIWDLQGNKLMKKLYGHSMSVNGIDYSPDSQKIASCGKDKIFQVIDVNTSLALYNKVMDSPLNSLNWSDTLLLIGAEDGVLYVWNILEVKILLEIKAHEGKFVLIIIIKQKSVYLIFFCRCYNCGCSIK